MNFYYNTSQKMNLEIEKQILKLMDRAVEEVKRLQQEREVSIEKMHQPMSK